MSGPLCTRVVLILFLFLFSSLEVRPNFRQDVREKDSVARIILEIRKDVRKEEAVGDFDGLVESLMALGSHYQDQYRYDLALESHFRALAIADSMNNYAAQAMIQHKVGTLYLEIRNLELAHEYLVRALELFQDLSQDWNLASTLNSLALTYWQKGELDTALNYLFRNLDMDEEYENVEGISRSCNNIGIVYHEMGQYAQALIYLQKSLDLKESCDDNWSLAETLNNMGENYISLGRFTEAERVLNRAQKLAGDLNALVLLSDNYRYLARLYQCTGDYQEALEYKEQFIQLEDSLFNRSKLAIISQMNSTFEMERQEDLLQLQENRIELLEKQRKISSLQNLILWGVVVAIFIIGAVLMNRQRKINQRNREIAQKDHQIQLTQSRLMEQERREKELLLNELEQKNSFLTDFALCIGMKNDLLYQVKERLKVLARSDENKKELRKVIRQLNQNLRQNRDLVEFQENVEKVNVDFLIRLDGKYPDMTGNEKQLAMFLRLNMSSKEISDFRAVSIKAVEMSRYRLRKKLGLDQQDSLRRYIQAI